MSVLFPAPFSPISACTSPGAISSETERSAWVPPNRLRTPRTLSRVSFFILQILRDRRIENFIDLGIAHVFPCGDLHASVHDFLDFLLVNMINDRAHAQVTHAHRILDDEALNISAFERLNRLSAGIEPDK